MLFHRSLEVLFTANGWSGSPGSVGRNTNSPLQNSQGVSVLKPAVAPVLNGPCLTLWSASCAVTPVLIICMSHLDPFRHNKTSNNKKKTAKHNKTSKKNLLIAGSNLGSGRNCQWGEWISSTLSTFNTMTEERPLSKTPNPQLLPGHRSIGCPLLRVCVHSVCVHLDGLNAEHKFRD